MIKASKEFYTDAFIDAYKGWEMRTTVNIDDDLYQQAVDLTHMKEKTALVRAGLKALIERESARRLQKLAGSEPQLDNIPRRQPAENG